MNVFANIRGAVLAIIACTASGASAAPITYDIDQALWGSPSFSHPCGANVAPWQDCVAAVDPANYNFITGQIEVDWVTETVDALSFTMEMNYFGNDLVDVPFTLADVVPGGFNRFIEDGTRRTVVVDLETVFGPLVGTPPQQQYTAEMVFSMSEDTETNERSLLIYGIGGTEYVDSGIFGWGAYSFTGFFGDPWPVGPIGNPRTQTLGRGVSVANTTPAPVPLPASLWGLMAGLGCLVVLRRRKA